MSYKIEYAKSNRSTCVICGQKIDKESIRIGVPHYFQDYLGYKWQHLDCTEFGGAVPSASEMEGFPELKADDQEKLQKATQGIKDKEILPTKIKDIITPNKIYTRIDATITKIGNIVDNTEAGGGVFTNITITDETGSINITASGNKLAEELVSLQRKGEYRFYGLKSALSTRDTMVLRYEGGVKYELVKAGVTEVKITKDPWSGAYANTKLTFSNRTSKCIDCSQEIPKFTIRYTTKGKTEIQPGREFVVDQHHHINCSGVTAEKYVDIFNYAIDNGIVDTWKYEKEKIEQAIREFTAEIKNLDAQKANELKQWNKNVVEINKESNQTTGGEEKLEEEKEKEETTTIKKTTKRKRRTQEKKVENIES